MEAKALTPQDLTSGLIKPTTPHTTTMSIDNAALTWANARSVPAPESIPGGIEDETIASAPTRSDAPTFEQIGVAEPICSALAGAGITKAFPIQALTLPIALDHHDVIGQARTRTGKTLAFPIPILQHLIDSAPRNPTAPRPLVVLPTRALPPHLAKALPPPPSLLNVP